MQCNACGTLLPPGASVCPRCGALTSSSSDYDAIPYIDHHTYAEQSVPSTQSASSVPVEARPLPLDAEKSVAAYPIQKAQVPGWMTALLILLALLFILGGVGSIVYAANFRPADLHAQATEVAQNFLTAQARETAQANSYATATAGSMTPEQVYQQATSNTPVIDDPLKDDSGNVWYNYAGGKDLCNFRDGAYHVQSSTYKSSLCTGYGTEFTNLAFQAQIEIITGGLGGLMFRNNAGNAYMFFIDTYGDYGFGITTQQNLRILQSGTNAAIVTGLKHPNLLTVIARNSHINLYVNAQPVATVVDTTCSSGQIAFASSASTSGPFDVAFNNVKVWEL